MPNKSNKQHLVKNFTIFDFDQTLTKIHSFNQRRIEVCQEKTFQQRQALGNRDALTNLKNGLVEYVKFNANQQFAIATYHNNS